MTERAEAVVVGAGIAGVATAYDLAVRRGVGRVAIVDPRPPLSLTSDKSTECYRNWWPNRPMVGLMNRSIDLLEEMSAGSGDGFGLSRRGYLFVTADPSRLASMVEQAHRTAEYGAGPVRKHPGPIPYREASDGVDVLSADELAIHYPYLTGEAVGAVHVRRAGWFSAQQLGAWMLDQARERGVSVVSHEVVDILTGKGKVSGVALANGASIEAPVVVAAAGPMSASVATWAGVDLPLFSELHMKLAFRDRLRVIPREAPLIVWSDPQQIEWSHQESEGLAAAGREDLLGEMPAFCHGRPEGGVESSYFLGLWEYRRQVLQPVWPIPNDPMYPEVVLRGLTKMVPGLAAYLERLPEPVVDGGYYTKTEDNRPIIGPAGPSGFHVVAGLSGFGVMASPGAADLVARHVTGSELPDYAESFRLDRYRRPGYLAEVSTLDSGQL